MNLLPFQKPDRAVILRVVGTLLGIALLFYLLAQQGWAEILQAFRQIPASRLALGVGLMIISRLAVSARWYLLLRSGGVRIAPAQALRINFAGLFANNFMFSTVGGDVIRLAGAMQLKFDAAVCAASLVADRMIGMAGMSLVLPIGLPRFLAYQQLAQLFFPTARVDEPALAAGGLASLPLGNLWRSGWARGMRIARRMLEALGLWLKQPRALLMALGFTFLHMACMFAFLWLVLDSMGQGLSFWLIGGLYSLVYFVTLLPISINGYGLQEVSMTLVFSSLGGASMAAGLTAALLFRTIMMLASLPGAIFVPDLLPHSSPSQSKR